MVVKVTYFDSVIVREDGAGISLGFRLEFRRQVKVGEDGVAFSWCTTAARRILRVRSRRRKAGHRQRILTGFIMQGGRDAVRRTRKDV